MAKLFTDAVVYDEPLKIGSRAQVNACEACFVCVPSPQAPDGSCNTEIVENVLEWIESDVIIIRSTVPVGFTKRMVQKLKKKIVFQQIGRAHV